MVHWNRLAVLGPLSRKVANPVPRWWRLVALPVKRSTGRGGLFFSLVFSSPVSGDVMWQSLLELLSR